MKMFRFVLVLMLSLVPLAHSSKALAWDAMSYQQALGWCYAGDVYACRVAEAYEMELGNRYRAPEGGSPADQWVSPEEARQERPGPLSTSDFLRRW